MGVVIVAALFCFFWLEKQNKNHYIHGMKADGQMQV